MYKRVAGVESDAQLEDVRGELVDRYGEPPPSVRNLLEYAALKLVCVRLGVAGIERKRDLVSIKFTAAAVVEPEKLARFVSAQKGAQFTPAGVLKFFLKETQAEAVLQRLRGVLEDLAGAEAAPNVLST